MNYLTLVNLSVFLSCVGGKTIGNIALGLLIGVTSSLIARYVVIGIKSLWFYRQYKSIGLEKTFDNQEKAKSDILHEADKSKKMDVFTVKADSFSGPNQMFNPIAINNNIQQRFLVSDPTNPYVNVRARELKTPNLAKSIELSIDNLNELQKSIPPYLICKLHKEVVRFRIYLFDDYLYLSFQKTDVKGKDAQILKIKKGSDMYETYSTYFDDLWSKYP